MKKAVILLSGGLDSVTCLAIAKSKDYSLYALTFRYGQRHQFEIGAAKECALSQQVENHIIMDIDLRSFGGSALTDNIDVPKDRIETNITDDIPITYVPARNTIFLSFALAYSESIGCSDIFIGVNALDYSGYPDCRPEYISAFEAMSNLATKSGVTGKSSIKIHTPLIDMGKHEIIKTGSSLGVDYSITHSCYDPDKNGISCGRCDACTLRLKGFKKAGIADPIQYAN
ncbi:MAG: 7-cyano-7-deazaguanine synthase QueC [Candidatus Neomarinimicrobiota bacterium]|jgi:7-cyano-7-deazaguanine synthase|tara:strand:- start:2235 stop:2921 length:687 start_codon:yes stop_codon:yes gene_type:complete